MFSPNCNPVENGKKKALSQFKKIFKINIVNKFYYCDT